MKVIDFHVHLPARSPKKTQGNPFYDYFSSTADALRYARHAGVDGMVFTTMDGVWCDTQEELDSANQEVLELYESDPEFLYPGVQIHPAYLECSKKWLKIFHDKGLMWVGELVHYREKRGPYDRKEWMELFHICHKYGMVVQLHGDASIITLAKKLPELRIVNSHITIENLPELATYPNIMIDVSGNAGGIRLGPMEAALKYFGADRVIFGTDFIAFQIEAFLCRAKQAFSKPADYKKIMSENLMRLLTGNGGITPFQKDLQREKNNVCSAG